MKRLKHVSDAFAVLALVFLVVGIVGPSWAYAAAGACFVAAVVTTSVKRRTAKARRTT